MTAHPKLMTVQEFEAVANLPENQDRLLELIHGELVEKGPTQEHGFIAARLIIRMGVFVEQQGLGRLGPEIRHKLPNDPHNARQPDISFYADTTTPVQTRGAVTHMPDLAVEIQSPDDSLPVMREKATFYIGNGARMVWLIYPAKKLVEVYTADGDIQLLTSDEILTGGEVLPGFTLAVAEIFKV